MMEAKGRAEEETLSKRRNVEGTPKTTRLVEKKSTVANEEEAEATTKTISWMETTPRSAETVGPLVST